MPEPETLGLLGTGLFIIGGLVRRKLKVESLSASSDISKSEDGVHAAGHNLRNRTAARWQVRDAENEASVMTHSISSHNQTSTVGGPVFMSPNSVVTPGAEAL